MALGKSFYPLKPQFPHMHNGAISIHIIIVVRVEWCVVLAACSNIMTHKLDIERDKQAWKNTDTVIPFTQVQNT